MYWIHVASYAYAGNASPADALTTFAADPFASSL